MPRHWTPDQAERWQKTLDSLGPGVVESYLRHNPEALGVVDFEGDEAEAVIIHKQFAVKWLGKNLDKEKTAQAERENRMVRATNAAAFAAWAAFGAALLSAGAGGFQGYAAMQGVWAQEAKDAKEASPQTPAAPTSTAPR